MSAATTLLIHEVSNARNVLAKQFNMFMLRYALLNTRVPAQPAHARCYEGICKLA